MNITHGFSKLTKTQKLAWLQAQGLSEVALNNLESLSYDAPMQSLLDEFSENTISNFTLPFSIAPNFLINNESYTIPMVIEESSVVAAASRGAKFWYTRGGFKTRVLSTTKVGHIHFFCSEDESLLRSWFETSKANWQQLLAPVMENMVQTGGGLKNINLIKPTNELDNYYKMELLFDTCDAMGANFINTVLEQLAQIIKATAPLKIDINMCILSNYTPECLVHVTVDCKVSDSDRLTVNEIEGEPTSIPRQLAQRLVDATLIAQHDVTRAVTHNKGIFNGIDAVVVATGNDYRAVEACGHAWAARSGQYRGLSFATIKPTETGDHFIFEMTIPLSLGTVGGLTTLHPLAKASLEILRFPNAKKLMSIVAAVGLAQNFSALRSLVTSGIQKGHMKMHLLNILRSLEASELEVAKTKDFFENRVVSFYEVKKFVHDLRVDKVDKVEKDSKANKDQAWAKSSNLHF